MFRIKPVSLIQRICSNSMRSTQLTARTSLIAINTQYRSFADTTIGGKLPGSYPEEVPPRNPQSENPHLYDPEYVPSEEADFDVDPQGIRVRQPLPKESFIPREEVLKRIIAVCEGMERCKTDGKVVTENSHLVNDLGLDSLDQVEFGLALEDEFDIEIPDDEAEQIVTLGDAVDLLADHPHAR